MPICEKMFGHPPKRIRLDSAQNNDELAGNEDLWGQDDLTAEEFDMLEIQATQSRTNQNANHHQNLNDSVCHRQNNFADENDMKQLQYELEGRIKLLSQSLEKSAKELSEERLHREHLIRERIKEISEREANLKKEVEKMQSILDFKDQEMKSTYSKLQMMKSQLQDQKTGKAEKISNPGFEDFLNSSKFNPCEHPIKPNLQKKFQRQNRLIIDTPKGETSSVDMLSSLLFTRLAFPFTNHDTTVNCVFTEEPSSSYNSTSVSVIKLKNEQKCDELLEYYDCFLRNHLDVLKSLASRNNSASGNKNSQISLKFKEAGYSCTAVSHLCDLAFIFCCPKTNPMSKEYIEGSTSHKGNSHDNVDLSEAVASSSTTINAFCTHKEEVESSLKVAARILESLSALSNPKTYPNNYPRNKEIEFSLSALFAISISNPEMFLNFSEELPIHILVNPLQNIPATVITLKVLISLCCCEKFLAFLCHKTDMCVMCLIGALLINLVPIYPENFAISVTLVQDFLSLVFSISSFAQPLTETSECISEVLQGLIISFLKYYEKREKISLSTTILKKGFLLLHYLSCCIPNFKERRHVVENEYISLISGMLALARESVEFKEFYDLAHSLWDFQSDFTEFDSDDLSDETQSSSKDMDTDASL